MNLSEQVVSDMVNFYYKEVRKQARLLPALKIRLFGLGWLTIKKWRIQKMDDKYSRFLRKYGRTISKEAVVDKMRAQRFCLQGLMQIVKEEDKIKKEVKKKKAEHERRFGTLSTKKYE